MSSSMLCMRSSCITEGLLGKRYGTAHVTYAIPQGQMSSAVMIVTGAMGGSAEGELTIS